LRHQIILKYYHCHVHFYKLFAARLIGFAFSYLIPSATLAGEPVRGHILVKSGLDPKISYASVILDKFWELGANFILMISFLLLALLKIGGFRGVIWAVIVGALIYLTVFFIFYSRIIKGKGTFTVLFRFLKIGQIFKRLNNFESKILETEQEVASFLKKRKKEFFQILFLSPFVYFSWLAEVWILAYLMGIKLVFLEVVLIQFFLGIVTIVPITGGLGVLESGGAGIFTLLKHQGAQGLTFSFLTRIKDLIYVFLGILFFLYFNFKNHRHS
ncbi:MAG: lysylphosphatidylglycerol synthase transmembrane domain-containing protein, partial [bacterium]|nr:lysylphosphatidylglycerol synthase transmembrane domain-containing protein [bacterium]